MEKQFFQVEVNNTPSPEDTLEYVIARRDKNDSSLWFYGTYDSEEQAIEISKLLDGIVLRKMRDMYIEFYEDKKGKKINE